MNTLLVIGNDIVPIATSANKAGYQVYSIDFYGDSDLKHLCIESRSIIHQHPGHSCGVFTRDYDVDLIKSYFDELILRYPIDGVILGSGLEDCPDILEHIVEDSQLIGNSPQRISQVRNAPEFFRTLNHLHISHPETRIAHNLEDAMMIGKDLGYPLILKPAHGFGGIGIQHILDQTSLQQVFNHSEVRRDIIIQEYIEGTPASVSTLSTNVQVEVISLNEQLIGITRLGATKPYEYCGNIVPLDTSQKVVDTIRSFAEKIITYFSLVGSNGIDFIVTERDECYIIEVNPRMQGTLECLERVYDINLVTAHITACTRNEILQKIWEPKCYCTRQIIYSLKTIVTPPLNHFQGVRDIPLEGTIIEQGEPLCSLLTVGSTRKQALNTSLNKVTQIINYLFKKQHA